MGGELGGGELRGLLLVAGSDGCEGWEVGELGGGDDEGGVAGGREDCCGDSQATSTRAITTALVQ